MNDRSRIRDSAALKRRPRVRRVIREVTEPGLVHPALIPGIGVEKTGKKFSTNWAVFAVAGVAVVAVILWAVFAPDSISVAGDTSLSWVIDKFGWLRSEEHTSELQSRGHIVCRLLLEKKKKEHY